MAGKIRAALVRKEADLYRSHGLHREAERIYRELLEGASRIDGEIREAVRREIELIRARECEEEADLQCRRLTEDLIAILKSGWGDQPTESDHLVCAFALLELGRPAEALEEFRNLMRRGAPVDVIDRAVARCLAALNVPAEIPQALERLAHETMLEPEQASAIERAVRRILDSGSDAVFTDEAAAPVSSPPQPRPAAFWARLRSAARRLLPF